MAIDPTAWASGLKFGKPGITESVLGGIAARQNLERSMEERQLAKEKAERDSMLASAALEGHQLKAQRERVQKEQTEQEMRQQAIEDAMGKASLPIMMALTAETPQDRRDFINEAALATELAPDDPIHKEIKGLLDVDEETQMKELATVSEWLRMQGYYGKKTGQAATPTDIDDFVRRANEQAIIDTGIPLSPGQQNEAALQFKRAQAKEVGQVQLAKRMADDATAESIAFNAELGKQLAAIKTAGELIEARGEITPVQKKQNANVRMSRNLATLTEHYLDLDSWGAIQNIEKNTFQNALATVRSSAPGQLLGKFLGTDAQSVRKTINAMKPILIQDIRAATEMGARGLDSEKELAFYIQAATDEKSDIQSNLAAIALLDQSYGEGKLMAELSAKPGMMPYLQRVKDGAVETRRRYQQFVTERAAQGKIIANKGVDPETGQIFVQYTDGTTEEVK